MLLYFLFLYWYHFLNENGLNHHHLELRGTNEETLVEAFQKVSVVGFEPATLREY